MKQTEHVVSLSLFDAPQEHHHDPTVAVFTSSDFLYCGISGGFVDGDSEEPVFNVALLFILRNMASVLSAIYPTAYRAKVDSQEKNTPKKITSMPDIIVW